MRKSKTAQVWIETVVYTLIGLAIIGTILAVVTPKIVQMNDKLTITQTIDSMNRLNEQIREALSAVGSQREILLNVKKGEYFIDAPGDRIYYYLKGTGYMYSQPNVSITQGDIKVLTTEKPGKKYDISLMLNYSAYNITYNGEDKNRTLTSAPTAYRMIIVNQGITNGDAKTKLDIKSIGG